AGVQPAIAQGARGLFGRVPVPLHDLRTANDDLAGLARRKGAFAGFDIDNAMVGSFHEYPAALELDSCRIERTMMSRRRSFGESVSLMHADAEARLDSAGDLGRKRCGGAEGVPDGAELGGLDVSRIGKRK